MDFRQYDPTTARFSGIDLLAESSYNLTPYHFSNNNPIIFSDPSGLKAKAEKMSTYGDQVVSVQQQSGGILSLMQQGYNGLDLRDKLVQEAWGPNFYVNGGSAISDGTTGVIDGWNNAPRGSVHLLSTNYRTMEVGYYVKNTEVWGSGKASIFYDSINNIWGVRDREVHIKFSNVWVPAGNYEPYNSTFVDDLVNGFINPKNGSDFNSASAWTGYASLQLSKTESLMKYVGASDNVLKVTKSLGRKLGYIGTGFSVYEDFRDNKLGAGTAVKATIGVLSVIFPGAGLAYAILDLGVGIATGTTITDRIAETVDGLNYN